MHIFQIKGNHEAIVLWSLITPWYTKSRGNMNVLDLVVKQLEQELNALVHCRGKCFWQHLAGADHQFSKTRIFTTLNQLKHWLRKFFQVHLEYTAPVTQLTASSVYRHCTVNRFQHCKAWNVCVKFIMLSLPWAD